MCLLSSFLNIAKGWASWIKFLQLPQMILRFVIELFKWSYDICKFDENLKDHETSWRHDFEKRIWKAWCKSRINDFNLPKYWIQEGDVPWFRFVIELKNVEIQDFEALKSWIHDFGNSTLSSKVVNDPMISFSSPLERAWFQWGHDQASPCLSTSTFYIFLSNIFLVFSSRLRVLKVGKMFLKKYLAFIKYF